MPGVLLVSTALTLLLLATARSTAAGWWWDMANGLGFAACALLLFSCVLIGRPPPAGVGLGVHRHLGWAAIAVTALHVAMMLADATTLQYLQAGAPIYMWAGCAACLPLLLLALSGLRRLRRSWFSGPADFRQAHVAWTLATVALATWHILGSGFYFPDNLSATALAALLTGVPATLSLHRRTRPLPLGRPVGPAGAWAAVVCVFGVFVLTRCLLA